VFQENLCRYTTRHRLRHADASGLEVARGAGRGVGRGAYQGSCGLGEGDAQRSTSMDFFFQSIQFTKNQYKMQKVNSKGVHTSPTFIFSNNNLPQFQY
jgi:hypothetical protein